MKKLIISSLALLFIGFNAFSQDGEETRSNVQTFTPSKLLRKGQWDIKFFNSGYTQTKQTDGRSNSVDIPRQSFFTSTTEVFTGLSENSRFNVGAVIVLKSNTLNGQNPFNTLSFDDNGNDLRSGLASIAPAIRFQPFPSIPTFSFTSSFVIPLFEDKADTVDDDVFSFLDQRSFAWETKFFYDRTFGGNKWQVFTEIDTKFNFGEKSEDAGPDENSGERFANNSLFLPLSAFLSYFPTSKSTVFVNTQQAFLIDLGNDFAQNSTAFGGGVKYQVTNAINVEASYSKIVRGNNFQGLGATVGLGLRALF